MHGSRFGAYPPTGSGGSSGLPDPGSNGLVARTGSGTTAARTITGPAAGISVTNGDGVSGNPTLALANDLAAIEGLSGTGIARRTGTDTWTVGTIVSIAEGGTGETTGPAALRALAGSQALSISSGTVAVDCSSGLRCTITVSANCTISNPTNATAGDVLTIEFTQNGTGGYWVDFGSAYEKPPVWSGANETTTHRWVYDGSTWRLLTPRTIRRRFGTDTTNSTTTASTATGSAYVPAPSSTFDLEYLLHTTADTGTTGVQTGVDAGNATVGGIYGTVPSTSVGTAIVSFRTPASPPTLLVSSYTATGGSVQIHHGIIVAGSSPTAVSLSVASETGGSTVTVYGSSEIAVARLA